MKCNKCNRRLRPLAKKDRLGRKTETFAGIKWCPICKVACITNPEAAKRYRELQRQQREFLAAETQDSPDLPPPESPKAA
jgi:hypothetical protein